MSNGAVKAILLAGAPRTAGGAEEELMLRATRAIVERPGPLPRARRRQHRSRLRGHRGHARRGGRTRSTAMRSTPPRASWRAPHDGQLLARDDVLERARTTYAATPIEPFAAKGKAELVRASDVGDAVGEREQEAIGPFVGREPELDTLLARAAQAGEGPGAPRDRDGRRRTRQVPAAGRALRPGGGYARRCAVQCAQTGASHPYCRRRGTPAARAAARPSTLRRPPSSAASAPSIGERAPGLEPWLPLLGLVVGLGLPATPESAALEDELRLRAHRGELSRRCSTACSRMRRSIVVDDAQFMDEASAALIGHIAAGIQARRWLLVVARRARRRRIRRAARASRPLDADCWRRSSRCRAAARRAADRGRAAPRARRGGDRRSAPTAARCSSPRWSRAMRGGPTTTRCPSRSRT